MSLGLIAQFQKLTADLLNQQYPLRVNPREVRNQDGSFPLSRPDAFTQWDRKIGYLVARMRQLVEEQEPHTLFGAQAKIATWATTFVSSESTLTGQQLLSELANQQPHVAALLTALSRVAFGFYNNNQTETDAGKEAIASTLLAANLTTQASAYIQMLMRDARTQGEMERAFALREQELAPAQNQQTLDAIRAFAIQFATVDLPIILATSVLSSGTLTLASVAWRVTTGIRLSTRVIMAAEMAVSIPISQAVDRALGRPVDDSFLGSMKQAGMMLGTQVGFRIIGRLGQTAVGAIRSRLGSAFGRPVVEFGVVGGGRIGQTSLGRLRDVQNLTSARIQRADNTCGFNAALSAMDGISTQNPLISISRMRAALRLNDNRGLRASQVVDFIDTNACGAPVATRHANVAETQLIQWLSGGRVIAGTDTNHWVTVLSSFQQNGVTWLRIYDPARGNYEQLLTSFMTRTRPNSEMVWVRRFLP